MPNKEQIRKTKTKKHLAREQKEAKQKRIILITTIAIGIVVLGLVGYALVDQLLVKPKTPVAKVGETMIHAGEFTSQVHYQRVQGLNTIIEYYNISMQYGEFGQSFLEAAQSIANQLSLPESFGETVLNDMINEEIIRQEAEKRGISVSEEELEQAFQGAFSYYPEGTLTPTITATIASTPTYSATQQAIATSMASSEDEEIPTTSEGSPTPTDEANSGSKVDEIIPASPTPEPTFTSTVAPQNSPTVTPTKTVTPTPTQYTKKLFNDNLKQFKELYSPYNFSLDDFKDLIEFSLLREKMVEEVTSDLASTKDEVWARHILVETEAEAEEVLAKLEEGADFNALAAEYSIDDSNSGNGGDLGWFDKTTMVEAFTEVAFSLDEGEISDPVETTFGYHIIQVLGKRESQIPPFELQQVKEEAFTEWLTELRESRDASGDITIYEGWEAYVPETPVIPQDLLMAVFGLEQ